MAFRLINPWNVIQSDENYHLTHALCKPVLNNLITALQVPFILVVHLTCVVGLSQ